MKRNRILLITLCCCCIATGLTVAQQSSEKPGQPTPSPVACPVTGNPANLAISSPTREGPVFFCAAGCVEKYKGEPAKYSEAVTKQRLGLAARPKVQVKCPVSGDPVDPKIKLEKDSVTVAFCSEDCKAKYSADPARYASALANAFTYQTICPVMKEPINPKSFTKLPSGQVIYYCCKGCDEKLLADPAKYAPHLKEQGFVFDLAPTKKEQK